MKADVNTRTLRYDDVNHIFSTFYYDIGGYAVVGKPVIKVQSHKTGRILDFVKQNYEEKLMGLTAVIFRCASQDLTLKVWIDSRG